MYDVLKVTVAAMALALCVAPAAGQPTTCATRAVKAEGTLALLEGAARGNARNAWVRRVSASKRLGPAYATWLRAKNPSYACKHIGKSYSCIGSAIPCKV